MGKPEKERREISQAGLLEAAMRTINQLITSTDLNTRGVAFRALSDVKRARKLVPARRKDDNK
ncbi:hypothetical protein Q8A64_04640 [Oxalobacteraceae bacterium R-40]|uniref:Uncharacterized protein n=1 Tax=Keguizhuia sedimenti TaxID=3064264 RepID=A0ABU1BL29_9BURK|nr:hypothetical protein [Oxalobacteraceae bacterium R-40]